MNVELLYVSSASGCHSQQVQADINQHSGFFLLVMCSVVGFRDKSIRVHSVTR